MLSLTKDLIKNLNNNSPAEKLEIEAGSLELYKSQTGNLLLDSQYLNIILRINSTFVLGFHIPSFQKITVPIEPTGNTRSPNMSSAVGMCKEANHIHIQHWDGYLSIFDIQNLTLLKQRVTR